MAERKKHGNSSTSIIINLETEVINTISIALLFSLCSFAITHNFLHSQKFFIATPPFHWEVFSFITLWRNLERVSHTLFLRPVLLFFYIINHEWNPRENSSNTHFTLHDAKIIIWGGMFGFLWHKITHLNKIIIWLYSISWQTIQSEVKQDLLPPRHRAIKSRSSPSTPHIVSQFGDTAHHTFFFC